MRLLATLGSLRAVIVVLTAITAVHMGLIAFSNMTDYGTNAEFVRHVFAMDTTFRSPDTMWRAIGDPVFADIAYLGVIVWEALTAAVLTAALIAWIRPRAGERGIEVARQLATLGWLMEVLLFGGAFIVIGGEWFLMWQSETWNGLEPALQNLIIASIGIILVQSCTQRRESARAPTGGTAGDVTCT